MRSVWRWWRRQLSVVMTGGRCHRRSKMMGRGPEGGCGTDERPFRWRSSAQGSPKSREMAKEEEFLVHGVDFLAQARKALSERSPFDASEEGPGSSGGSRNVCTLPSGLVSLLKLSDSRKRHKKSHSSTEKKSNHSVERSKGRKIWVETEDYFRDLTLHDIDALSEASTFLRSSAGSKLLSIPCLGKKEVESGINVENVDSVANAKLKDGKLNGDVVVVVDEVKQEDRQSMEIDGEVAQNDEAECLVQSEEKGSSASDLSSGIEWLLGCRNRNMLTSVRPLKKRKLLASGADLEKIMFGSPCTGNLLCDFCCRGELGNDSNQLIVCSSCKVSVHPKCYGVYWAVDGESWLCSWCKQKAEGSDVDKQPCVLCSKRGGALKPLAIENGGSPVQFAHLFCSLWMPEVYVEDLVKMEPIFNVGGIKETRKRLFCSICKVKCGACVQCSHGSCRAAFHPICAREGRHRMDVWGKYGCDDVELRAFCSKHSENLDRGCIAEVRDPCVAVESDSSVANGDSVTSSAYETHQLRTSQNGDKTAATREASDASSERCDNIQSQEMNFADCSSDIIPEDCSEADRLMSKGTSQRSHVEDANHSKTLNLLLVLKKLLDRGKVNVNDVASEIGTSPDLLITTLADNSSTNDLQFKIFKWFSNHVYMASDSDVSNPVAVKSLRRRTRSDSGVLGDQKLICSSQELPSDNKILMDDIKVDQMTSDELETRIIESIPSVTAEKSLHHDVSLNSLVELLPKLDGSFDVATEVTISETAQLSCAANAQLIKFNDVDEGTSSDAKLVQDLVKVEILTSKNVHPSIRSKLMHIDHGLPAKSKASRFEDLSEEAISCLEASSNASVCCNHQDDYPKCNDLVGENDGPNLEQFLKAKKLGVLEMSPEDEVEGELLYFQHRLLDTTIARKRCTDNLVCKVAKSLPLEIDATRSHRWDAILVNLYLSELREAKKQGRKERRHKEAQAVLAAATAAAAASSRNSLLRKDALDEPSSQEKFNSSNGRGGTSSQLIPCPKERLSRIAVPRTSLEKYSDYFQSVSDFSKEHLRSCDICRRTETILNPILVCSSCKVAVHLDCYRSVKESTGPWHCELCEELLSSRSSGAPSVNVREKPYFVAECCLCGGITGAFRKTSDGQWAHAFCAEWVFESTYRRGQVNPVEGMDAVSKGVDFCCICRHNQGVCIKCNYGHCQTMFHPFCAKSTGFYMDVKIIVGKYQHKAYCEKHSMEQRAKAETQKHGTEELRSMKQIRVELERLRLLCERIVKREKIKRDLVLCSHSILACKRDHVARSLLAHSPYFLPEGSSGSATTSLKGNTDGYRSYSDAIQKSDDITVDSAVSGKRRIKVTMSMDTDRKTDDSSTSQSLYTRKPMDRLPYPGKQLPQRPSPGSQNLLDDGEWSSGSRKTFEKELIMTSDQASMKNRQLPKGYIYIPVKCIQNEKQSNQNASSGEPLDGAQ